MVAQSLVESEWQAPAWGNLQSNLQFLSRVGVLTRPSTLLEIGCGKGTLLDAMQRLGHTVEGIDVDADAIALAHSSYPTISSRVASGDSLPFPSASFDAVLSFDVFEHIPDSDVHIREVSRVLKPGGHYLLQTPNKWTNIPFELLRHWRKFGMGPLAGYRTLVEEHCSLHNYWELRRRFTRHGLRTTFYDIPVVNEYFISKMHSYFGAAASPLLTLFNPDRLPLALRTNFYVKAERLTD